MATIHVKDVPERVYRALKARARRSGRSLAAEVRQILDGLVRPERSPEDMLAAIDSLRRRRRTRPRRRIDLDGMILEDRLR